MKVTHTMKETLSLVLIDVILVLVLLDKSLVRKIHVIKPAITKAIHTMKEILSLAKMDATVALVLLDRSLVQKIRVYQRLAALTLIVILVIFVL